MRGNGPGVDAGRTDLARRVVCGLWPGTPQATGCGWRGRVGDLRPAGTLLHCPECDRPAWRFEDDDAGGYAGPQG